MAHDRESLRFQSRGLVCAGGEGKQDGKKPTYGREHFEAPLEVGR